MLRTASSLALAGLLTLGSDTGRFPPAPPACCRASCQLPGPGFHRQATTSLRTRATTMRYVTWSPPVLLGARMNAHANHSMQPLDSADCPAIASLWAWKGVTRRKVFLVASTAAGIADTICAVVLLVAGALKLGRLSVFGQQVAAYQIVPERLARVAGYVLPPAEMALGISMLFVPRLAVAAVVLFVLFALAVGVNILRGRTELRCGCFGAAGKHTISRAHVAANVGLALLATLTFVGGVGRDRASFLAFQIGVSALLLVALAAAWRAMASPTYRTVEEAPEQWPG